MSVPKKLYLFIISAVAIHFLFVFATTTSFEDASGSASIAETKVNNIAKNDNPANSTFAIYDSLHLAGLGLSRHAFDYAVRGYNYLSSCGKLSGDQIISIVDFSLASSKKRLFILDLKNNKVLFNTYVSHGRNSGKEMASEFSNEPESNKSSLGFYITGDTYIGKHGFSMRLFGEEKGINDNANSRAIVMHCAPYVSEAAIQMQGFLGRSLGCPALPENVYKPIIEKIKNGTCLFLYSPDLYYRSHSDIIKKIA